MFLRIIIFFYCITIVCDEIIILLLTGYTGGCGQLINHFYNFVFTACFIVK